MAKVKMIEITEKNFDWISSRIKKFFEGKSIVYWHNFDCGSKRHIQGDFVMRYGESYHTRPIYRYAGVEVEIKKELPIIKDEKLTFSRYGIVLHFNQNCGDVFGLGTLVGFAGNRIHIRSHSLLPDKKYIYDVYQLWDPNGGFKNISIAHDDWPILDDWD